MARKEMDERDRDRRLEQWHADGIAVKLLWKQDPKMTSIASALFGSSPVLALAAAGIESVRQTWTRVKVIEGLRQTRGRGLAVPSTLNAAAIREFKTIRLACKAAGVRCLTNAPPHCNWIPTKVIDAIRTRHTAGHDLRSTCREDPALYAAAKRLFGTWTDAREAAGFPVPRPVQLSADEVKRRIRRLHRCGTSFSNMRVNDPDLYRSAKRCFGSLSEALRAVGLEASPQRRWSKQRVVKAIQVRHSEGKELNRTWYEDKPLFRAAVTWFGNWEPAMLAAGFEPIKRERWSKRRVIERLRTWRDRTRDTNLAESDPNLAAAARRLFGTLGEAYKAAEIEATPRRWTQTRVITEIQERYVRGEPRHIQGLGDIRLANAAKQHFESRAAAVNAAGSPRIPIAKPLKRWNRAKVIKAIQRATLNGVCLSDISKSDQGLYNAAKTHFGTWRSALMAAGIPPSRRQWSEREIVDEIRQRQRDGRSLSSGHPDNTNLAAAAARYFGSWTAALTAAGAKKDQAQRKVAS